MQYVGMHGILHESLRHSYVLHVLGDSSSTVNSKCSVWDWDLTMTATNLDDQLGEIFPTMLNEFNCTFGVSFHCCGRRCHGLWPLWYRPRGIAFSVQF